MVRRPSLEEIKIFSCTYLASFFRKMLVLQNSCKPMSGLQESCKTMQILQADKLQHCKTKNAYYQFRFFQPDFKVFIVYNIKGGYFIFNVHQNCVSTIGSFIQRIKFLAALLKSDC